jgi:hypothetical protein
MQEFKDLWLLILGKNPGALPSPRRAVSCMLSKSSWAAISSFLAFPMSCFVFLLSFSKAYRVSKWCEALIHLAQIQDVKTYEHDASCLYWADCSFINK